MLSTLTARYTRIESGYMGQVVEWPEVVTEGRDLDDCRAQLQDALREMVAAYQQLGREIPQCDADHPCPSTTSGKRSAAATST